jgi:tripartite motif-containing protein 71
MHRRARIVSIVLTTTLAIALPSVALGLSRSAAGVTGGLRAAEAAATPVGPAVGEVFTRTGAFPQLAQPWYFVEPGLSAVDAASGDVYVLDGGDVVRLGSDGTVRSRHSWVTSESVSAPAGIAVASGKVYLSDTAADTVCVYSAAGSLESTFGGTGSTPGSLRRPQGLSIEADGDLLVVDAGNYRVAEYSPAGTFKSVFAAAPSITTSGPLVAPSSITCDQGGRTFVFDAGDARHPQGIRVFASDRRLLTSWTTHTFTTGAGPDSEWEGFVGGPALACDGTGAVYATDYTIAVESATDPFSGSVVKYQPYSAEPAGVIVNSGFGTLALPVGLCADRAGGYVYLSQLDLRLDAGFSLLGSVEQRSLTGCVVADWRSWGPEPGHFAAPSAAALDSAGNLYVVDAANSRVEVFDPAGGFLRAWGSTGTGNGQFDQPAGIAVTAAGRVYVTDAGNDRVQYFSTAGTYLGKFGTSTSEEDWVAPAGTFVMPQGIAVDSAGYVYVVDQGNGRVQKLTAAGVPVLMWGASSEGWSNLGVVSAGIRAAAVRSVSPDTLSTPVDIAVSATGLVYVTDADLGRVVRFNTSGAYLGSFGTEGYLPGQMGGPTGLTVDSAGRVWVADGLTGAVTEYTSDGAYLTYVTDEPVPDAHIASFADVVVDANGMVRTLDAGTNRVVTFTGPTAETTVTMAATSASVRYGGSVSLVFGATGVSGSLEPSTPLTVQSSYDGRNWSDVRVITSADGTYTTTVAPVRASYYRAVFRGDATHRASASTARRTVPGVLVGTPGVPGSVRLRTAFTISGTIRPKHATGGHSVKIVLQRKEGSRWKTRATVVARDAAVGSVTSYSRYSVSAKVTLKGSWRAQAVHAYDGLHGAGTSAWTYFSAR